LQQRTSLRAHAQGEIGKRLPNGMQIGFALNPANRNTMPPSLRHVDVDGDLPLAAFDHELCEKIRMREQRLAVRHQHRDRAG